MPMKVAIDCRSFLQQNYTGIGRYSYHLLKSLSQIDQINEYYLNVRRRLFDLKRRAPRFNADNFYINIGHFRSCINRVLKNTDIYHSPSPEYLNYQEFENQKIVVTVHDLICKIHPHYHTKDAVETTERQLEQIIDHADRIICCSESTRQDLHYFFPETKDRTRLIYQGVDHSVFYPLNMAEKELARQVLRSKGVEEPFLLFVGTIEPRKNLRNILHALSVLKRKKKFKGKLAVIGMKGWMYEEIEPLIKGLGLKNDVIRLGYLADYELRYFYNLTEAFVMPSFYEGFGFPIVEAFCCGAPVITSNVSSCPEIAGEAAMAVDPHKAEDIVDAVDRIIQDNEFKNNLKYKSLERAREFSFLKTAEETLNVYKEVYKK